MVELTGIIFKFYSCHLLLFTAFYLIDPKSGERVLLKMQFTHLEPVESKFFYCDSFLKVVVMYTYKLLQATPLENGRRADTWLLEE